MRILFVATRFPYPTITGDRLRSYIFLKNAAQEHEVTLVCFSNGASPEHIAHVRPLCVDMRLVPWSRLQSYLRVLGTLVAGRLPLQVAYFYSAAMRKLVRELVASRRYDLVHVNFVRCSEYLRGDRSVPRVLDFCDSLALELSRRVQYQKSWRRPIYRIEARRMAIYEHEIAREYDRLIAISPVDAANIRDDGSVDVVVNSVQPGRVPGLGSKRPLSIVFSGNVGFYSDELALVWFMQRVFPRVLERVPGAQLHIVGANPSARLRAMASDRVIVTGYVDDLKRYVSECMVSISPMQVGAGLKNKILEAMAHGVPVVATTLGNQGVRARHDESALIADEPEAFADAVVRLLTDAALRERIGRGGYRLIETVFSDEVVKEGLLASYARAMEAVAERTGRGTVTVAGERMDRPGVVDPWPH